MDCTLDEFAKEDARVTPWIVRKTSKFLETRSFIETRALKRKGVYPDPYKVLFSSERFDCFDKFFAVTSTSSRGLNRHYLDIDPVPIHLCNQTSEYDFSFNCC